MNLLRELLELHMLNEELIGDARTVFDDLWDEYDSAEDTSMKEAGDKIADVHAGKGDEHADIMQWALDAQDAATDEMSNIVNDPLKANDLPKWVSRITYEKLAKLDHKTREKILDKFGESVYDGLT